MAMPKEEFSRKERYYAAIAGKEGVKPEEQFSREEQYLNAIDEHLDTKADLVNGEVPSSELPSYVDDVLEFADKAHFPATGETGKIYVALDTNKTYRWSGSAYVEISSGPETKILDTADFVDDQPTEDEIIDILNNDYSMAKVMFGDSSAMFMLSSDTIDDHDGYFRRKIYTRIEIHDSEISAAIFENTNGTYSFEIRNLPFGGSVPA